MIKKQFIIDPDIRKAQTLPAEFYKEEKIYQLSKEKIFARSWQFAGDISSFQKPGQIYPLTLLEGYLDEPLLLTRDLKGNIHCLSDVCTHRGNILVESPCEGKLLLCRYHGRRFELDGKFKSMPEFEDAEGFPSDKDNLPNVKFELWDKFIFVSLNPVSPLDKCISDIKKRLVGILNYRKDSQLDKMVFDPSRSRDYFVKANWALYCDNYLEGFHIPYVHSGLNEKIDYSDYSSEIYDYCNLQLALAKRGRECFELHEISPDYGKEIAAYYWWIFPNTMFNFYPWGLSINVVKPLAFDLTKVSYYTYVSDASKLGKGAGSNLDKVELEDEAIVENVQKGMNSRLYSRGRYSPKREQGVHHFHRLLLKFLSDNPIFK